jgi:GNAT superfamily N-acetyltransferase
MRVKLNNEEEFDIYKGEASDCKYVIKFIRMLAEYEKALDEVLVDEQDLINDGFSGVPRFETLVCFKDGEPAGMALFYHRYSTWKGTSLYLEDIFIDPKYRRLGIATSLMNLLCELAVERNCERFEWQVLDWNQPAIDFYAAMKPTFDSEWINVKMTLNQTKEYLNSIQ